MNIGEGLRLEKHMETSLKHSLLPRIAAHLEGLVTPLGEIASPHQAAALQLAQWVSTNHRRGEVLPVIMVCTGNSRRSILGAMMGNAAAAYCGFPDVRFYSAGITPSAFNPRTIAALTAVGFAIESTGDDASPCNATLPNPKYRVRWGMGVEQELVEFSKAIGDASLPKAGFAAMMVCSEAAEGCPVVSGAAVRIPMPLVDPKDTDDTPEEPTRYAATRDELGRIMLGIFELIDTVSQI
jgi:arsenate reductase (thioredoxin)